MIQFACPECSKRYEVADTRAGQDTFCVKCGEALRVPGRDNLSMKSRHPHRSLNQTASLRCQNCGFQKESIYQMCPTCEPSPAHKRTMKSLKPSLLNNIISDAATIFLVVGGLLCVLMVGWMIIYSTTTSSEQRRQAEQERRQKKEDEEKLQFYQEVSDRYKKAEHEKKVRGTVEALEAAKEAGFIDKK
jgi:F0F1-type ATP synthase epsilon subunit